MPRSRANVTTRAAGDRRARRPRRRARCCSITRPAAPVAVESKSSATDMVSAADRASEELLVELLDEARPDDG